MTHITRIVSVLIFTSTFILSAELTVVKSTDVTSADIPLKFTIEKTTWDSGNIRVWGRVKNNGNKNYTFVKVILTAKDSKDGFIGRNTWYFDPSDISIGQVGYIEDKFIECENKKPFKIEYSVIGNE